MKITILYGTESGNAELVSEDIETELNGEHDVSVTNLEDTSHDSLDPESFHIIVCSTYGEGELPASAIEFADAITENAPDLSAIRFAIFGLGDTSYDETYNHGSMTLKDLLIKHNAQMVGERGLHDAATGEPPEEAAIPWVKDILSKV